jgi:hypothetical protein
MPFENHIKAIKQFEDNVDDIILSIVNDNETRVLDLNRVEQMFKQGIDAGGAKIRPKYTPFTVKVKLYERNPAQPVDRVTLKDSGDFHGSFYLEFGPDYFEVNASDAKTKKLRTKYSDQIFGLTDKHVIEVAEDIVKDPFINEAIKTIIK